jgi:osmotically-inducible protein OsmY
LKRRRLFTIEQDGHDGSLVEDAMLETQPAPVSSETITPDQVEAEAEQRLRKSSSFVLRNVACQFRDGVLILLGQLPSYHHKQIAQELVGQIGGVRQIENQIEVISPDSSTWLG